MTQSIWKAVLAELELQLSRANFITWFRNTNLKQIDNEKAIIAVPNSFIKEWLENKYNKLILRALRNNHPGIKTVGFTIETPKIFPQQLKQQKTKNQNKESQEIQLGFEEFKIDRDTHLNPKYTFDSFIVGPSNELAHAAAYAVAKQPGKTYNPLFIYGGVGLGKTHLLQAIGNKATQKNKKVKYLPSERFVDELITAIHNQKVHHFREKYRAVDVLIIDDVQFIAGKEKTQEEFFHTFNTLNELNKQIVLSSDRPPKAIPTLEERLRSRFEGGMVADIGSPEYETRVAILKIKVKNKKTNLPDDVADYIANNIQNNIRELEGAVNILITASRVQKKEINLQFTQKALLNFIKKPKKIINYKKVLREVADFYEVSEKNIIGKNRAQEIAFPRQVIMYIMRNELKNSFPFIAEKIGGRDHTTVMHACQKIKNEIRINENIEEEIKFIIQKIYSG